MPIDWSTRPSSSIATHRVVKAPPSSGSRLPPNSSGTTRPKRPEVTHLRDEVGREVRVPVPLGHVRLDLALGEVAHDLAEVLVVLAELEHRSSSRGRGHGA